MKTKLLLIALAFALMSGTCEADKSQEPENCNCGTIKQKVVFNIPNNTFTKLTVENNCTHDVTEVQVTGNQYEVGQQYCNE